MRLVALFAEAGLETDRLEIIAERPPLARHFALYGRIDVALDPVPYNGTTTTLEAMWMGVPVPVLADGDRHAARVRQSLLIHAGMPEMVARGMSDLVGLAASTMARELSGGRRARRVERRARLAASPLCDAPGFARRLEALFLRLRDEA